MKRVTAIVISGLALISIGLHIRIIVKETTPVQVVQPTVEKTISLPVATVKTVKPVAKKPSFESMQPCQQLDVLAKNGKPVANFLVKSDLSRYQSAIESKCQWHKEQLAVVLRPKVQQAGAAQQVNPNFQPDVDPNWDTPVDPNRLPTISEALADDDCNRTNSCRGVSTERMEQAVSDSGVPEGTVVQVNDQIVHSQDHE